LGNVGGGTAKKIIRAMRKKTKKGKNAPKAEKGNLFLSGERCLKESPGRAGGPGEDKSRDSD